MNIPTIPDAYKPQIIADLQDLRTSMDAAGLSDDAARQVEYGWLCRCISRYTGFPAALCAPLADAAIASLSTSNPAPVVVTPPAPVKGPEWQDDVDIASAGRMGAMTYWYKGRPDTDVSQLPITEPMISAHMDGGSFSWQRDDVANWPTTPPGDGKVCDGRVFIVWQGTSAWYCWRFDQVTQGRPTKQYTWDYPVDDPRLQPSKGTQCYIFLTDLACSERTPVRKCDGVWGG